VAEDYYRAMSSVEKRLDLLANEEDNPQVISESERDELLALTEQLLEPKLHLELCFELVTRIRMVLNKSDSILIKSQKDKPLLKPLPP
jgi:hypothetical protein